MALADALNAAPGFPENAQVVIAPTALHLLAVKDRLKRPDVEVAAQNVYAFLGETRRAHPARPHARARAGGRRPRWARGRAS